MKYVIETRVTEYEANPTYNIVIDTLATQPLIYRARVYKHWVDHARGDRIEALELDEDYPSYEAAFENAEAALLSDWHTDATAWDWQQ